MGEKAVFIEHPTNNINRVRASDLRPSELPFGDPSKMPYTICGPYLKELFDFNESLPDEEEDGYTTLAGFILSLSGTIPNEKDKYECGRFIFEIIDLDGHQIDKVLVTDLGPQEPINTEE